jgi:hypothetical protein
MLGSNRPASHARTWIHAQSMSCECFCGVAAEAALVLAMKVHQSQLDRRAMC